MAAKTWARIGDGLWAVDGNWSPGPAATALDDVTLVGGLGTATQVITGPGASASLVVVGNSILRGAFTTGGVRVGTASAVGSLGFSGGAVLAAAGLAVVAGNVAVAGARVSVTGVASLGGTPGTGANTARLNVTSGGFLQVGGLSLLPADAADQVTVDPTAVLEVGTRGGAAVGMLTVDAGQMLSGAGSIAAGIENDGTILAQGGTLVMAAGAALLGTGSYQIGAGATLSLSGAAAGRVAFTGAGGTLALVTAFGPQGLAAAAPAGIAGFGVTDTISITGATLGLSGVQWNAATGVLALTSGTTSLGTLALAGDFTGFAFQVTPSGVSSSTANIALAPVAAGGVAAGTAAADAYAWRSGGSGAWNVAGNWTDTTLGTGPAAAAAGANDGVTLQGPGGSVYQVITGAGAASSLVALGRSSLAGAVSAGAVAVGSMSTAGALNVASGGSLAAASLALLNGPMQVTGPGARLVVAGGVVLGGALSSPFAVASDTLSVVGGGGVQAGSLTLLPGRSFNSVSVDGASTLEVGRLGRAAAGTLTVDAGSSVVGAGSLAGAIVNDGVIVAQGGTLNLSVTQSLGGSGTLEVDAGATLTLSGPTTENVLFRSSTGTLGFTSFYGLGSYVANPLGVIGGFRQGDGIAVAGLGVVLSAVRWQAVSATRGTLTLLAGTAVIGVLTLAGDFTGAVWTVTATGGGSALVTASVPARAGNPYFDADAYLTRYLDVAFAGVDPWQHYDGVGWKEGRDPSAAFDTLDYLAANPDVKAAGLDPLLHYAQYGRAEGRAAFAVPAGVADPLVDAAYYYAHNADVRGAGVDASAHYHAAGRLEGRNPDAWFDTGYYLAQNPDVAAAGIDPLLHFEQFGWVEGRAPSLVFDGARYLAAYADVASAGVDPLLQYVTAGQAAGRAAFLVGGLAAADPLVDAGYYDRQLGASLVPAGVAAQQQAAWLYDNGGWQRGLNPDAWFDTAYYQAHNPDVAAAHVDPLLHYETYGWREGRDPSAQFSTGKYLAANADVRAAGLDPLLHFVAFGLAEGRVAFGA